MRQRRIRSILLALTAVGIAAAFVLYLYAHADEYRGLLQVSAGGLALLALLWLAVPLFNGMQNTILYRSLGVSDFSHRDGFLIAAASSLANQLPIPGGILSKGFYLKRMHRLSYGVFASSTLAIFVCFISLDGFIGLLVLLYWALAGKPVSLSLWVGFLLMAAGLLIFWLPVSRLRLPGGLHDRVQRALEGWTVIRANPPMVFRILLLQVALVACAAARYWLAFRMLSQPVSPGQVLLMSTASILTQVVSIAPGGLGVRETIVGAVAAVLGFDMAVSVLAVGLDRLVTTLMLLIVGGIATVMIGRQMAVMEPEPAPDVPESPAH